MKRPARLIAAASSLMAVLAILAGPAARAQAPDPNRGPNPASEAAVRRMTDEALRWDLNYALMTDDFAQRIRAQEPALRQLFTEMGRFESIAFVGVDANGMDVYDVTHANGVLRWSVRLAPNGKTSNAFVLRKSGFVETGPTLAGRAVLPAVDGIFLAFRNHSVVALGDDHGLAQEMDFYAEIVRDPRFAREVGNVVIEFGAAGRRNVIDRYLAGETVPYTELRTVWTDVVGWTGTAGYLGFVRFFAAVREVNMALAPEDRIRVWLGEPPIDWSTATRNDVMTALSARDSHPADVIVNDILATSRKALVIYGNVHLGGGDMLRGRVEAVHPDAFFVVLPYSAIHHPAACAPLLEQAATVWPTPAIAISVGSGAPDPVMRECTRWNAGPAGVRTFVLQRTPDAGAGPPPAAAASVPLPPTGVVADAVLFFGPLETLTRGLILPDYFLDSEYRLELGRRRAIGAPALLPFPEDLSLRRSDYDFDLHAPGYAERLDAMFAEHDGNGDGVVTAGEYIDPVPQ